MGWGREEAWRHLHQLLPVNRNPILRDGLDRLWGCHLRCPGSRGRWAAEGLLRTKGDWEGVLGGGGTAAGVRYLVWVPSPSSRTDVGAEDITAGTVTGCEDEAGLGRAGGEHLRAT